ncbi:MAG: immune inhibitor A [Anaerolineae bacterium]|nr:immune inhibitor A [Anaerolineae bacterium]
MMFDDDQDPVTSSRKWAIVLTFAGCAVSFACMALLIIVAAAVIMLRSSFSGEDDSPTVTPALEMMATVTATEPTAMVTAMPVITATEMIEETGESIWSSLVADGDDDVNPDVAVETEDGAVENEAASLYLPPRDYYEVARRMGSVDVGTRTVTGTIYSADDIGAGHTFFVDDRKIKTTLAAVTDRTYFWVDNRLNVDFEVVQEAADRFEAEFYPIIVALFGEEWSPGVDGDPHFSVVHLADNESGTELGFFVSSNEYPRSIERYSNEQEVVFMNMDRLDFDEDLYFGTLVHEVQHLIHWQHDSNEEAWLDEGLGQLAEVVVGLDTAGSADYMVATDIQFNAWDYDDSTIYAHYGASYLFSVYVWEQLGDAAIRDLIADPVNGLASVRTVLAKYRPQQSLQAFINDWMFANLINDTRRDPRYGYESIQIGLPRIYERVKQVPTTVEGTLAPFGVHYIALQQAGPLTATLTVDDTVELVPSPPSGNDTIWYVPPTDNLNAMMTTELDLSATQLAVLSFAAWYELEEGYDFAYVLVSADNGTTWEIVEPSDAVWGEFGPALGGNSNENASAESGWVRHDIELDRYAGQPILVRIELLTDLAVSGGGMALDAFTLTTDTGAITLPPQTWTGNGIVRLAPQLPRSWSAFLIPNDEARFREPVMLDFTNRPTLTLSVPPGGATMLITTSSDYGSVAAPYHLSFER